MIVQLFFNTMNVLKKVIELFFTNRFTKNPKFWILEVGQANSSKGHPARRKWRTPREG